MNENNQDNGRNKGKSQDQGKQRPKADQAQSHVDGPDNRPETAAVENSGYVPENARPENDKAESALKQDEKQGEGRPDNKPENKKEDKDKGKDKEEDDAGKTKKGRIKKLVIIGAVVIVLAMIGYYIWSSMQDDGPGEGFAGGNGRIEATEIDISTKLAGRIEEIRVDEGDFVEAGQVLAIMNTDVLTAQLAEARAQYQQALTNATSARAQVTQRQSDKVAAEATVAQRNSELDSIQRRLDRTTVLTSRGAVAEQQYDDEVTSMHGARAAIASAEAQVAVADAAIETAKAEVAGAEAAVKAAQATVERVEADIKDSTLVAPRTGRIQYRIAQPGEVMGAGGKVLNLVDLSDVYMTFFLPATETALIQYGSEARIILDAAPDYPVPATITYVASTAQFTPKTVETESEREKLMFRVKAQINRELLKDNLEYVKTGLPGMAWVKTDPNAEWPESMAIRTR